MLRSVGVATCLAVLLTSGGRASGAPASAGELAPLLDNLGGYHYPVSDCSGPAQKFFDQGLRFIYAFQFAEALASFRESSRLDPDCAMAHWGEALSTAPNPNNRYFAVPEDPRGAGAEAIRQATHLLDRTSEMERGLIEALSLVYDEAEPDREKRDRAYINAMRRLASRFPEDPEVLTQLGAAIMTASPWDYWNADGTPRPGTEEALEAFERVLARDTDHPGANHLYIHLMEDSQQAELALPHAERLARTMPGSGHLVHMPSHIYIVTGRYDEAIESNRRSVEADEAMAAAWGGRALPMEAVGWSASFTVHITHAQDFLHMAAVLQGNYAAAIESARIVASISEPRISVSGVAAQRFVRPWLTRKRFGMWAEILKTPLPQGAPAFVAGIWHYCRGSALAATGQLPEAERELARLREAAGAPGVHEFRVRVNPADEVLTIAAHLLSAEIAAQHERLDDAIAHVETAVRLEDGLGYMEPPDWANPARLSLGAVLLQAGRFREAEVVYWEDLRRHPENGWSLYGVWQSLLRQGQMERAAEAEARFREAWKDADITLPPGS